MPPETMTPLPVIHHRTADVDGIEIFYREAGSTNAPAIVLLHGFPTSSHMFRRLIPALADRYHVIAPDLPGFGLSAMPDRKVFEYSFNNFSYVIDSLIEQLGVRSYALYVMDYGAPTGFRLALRHPERVTALIVQNGNAYVEGMQDFWDQTRRYWDDPCEVNREAMRPFLSIDATRFQYVDGVRDVSRIDPSCWLLDQLLLDRPGCADIQLDIIYDYRTNVEIYPRFHAYFRHYLPPTLIVWGANDRIFPPQGAQAFLTDLPHAELHMVDSGHFALEDKIDEIAPLIRDFLGRNLTG